PSVHIPVLVSEAVDALAVDPAGTYVDGTFGRGGHSRAILERLGPRGRLIALDRDPDAEQAARGISDARFAFFRTRFSALAGVLNGARGAGLRLVLAAPLPPLRHP